MDDLNRKLEEILNDPESMNRVREMAGALLGDDSQSHEVKEEKSPTSLGSAEIGQIMNIINRLHNSGNDNRTKLLLALKPHLSGKRQEKVDSAVKLLKLIEALPLLKEAGILNFG